MIKSDKIKINIVIKVVLKKKKRKKSTDKICEIVKIKSQNMQLNLFQLKHLIILINFDFTHLFTLQGTCPDTNFSNSIKRMEPF